MNNHLIHLRVAVFALLLLPMGATFAESVEGTVRDALQTHPRVLASQDEVQLREHNRRAAEAGYYPSVDVYGRYGPEYTNSVVTRGATGEDDFVDLDRQEVGISLRQNLFRGLETKYEVARQDARVGSAEALFVEAREQVALQATQAYLQVSRDREVLDLARQLVAAHESIYDKIRLRSESGLSKRADLDQAEGRLALARSVLVNAEANLRDSQAAYERVVGHSPSGSMERPAAMDSAMPVNRGTAVSMAQENSPGLAAAQAEVEAAMAARKGANGRYYPTLDLVLERNWNRDVSGLEGKDEDYGAFLEARWNLLSGGADTARKRAAVEQFSQAQQRRDDVLRVVREGMTVAWTNYESIDRSLGFLEAHANHSRQTRDAYAKQFSLGQRSLLDLLNTENEVFQSSRDLVGAQHDRLAAQYRVLSLLGELEARLLGEIGAP